MELNARNLRIIPTLEFSNNPIGHHIDSMNEFYSTGIQQICTDTFTIVVEVQKPRTATEEDRAINNVVVKVKVTHVMIDRPTMRFHKSGKIGALLPSTARELNRTYSSPLRINAEIEAIAYKNTGDTIVKESSIKNYQICRIPTMVRSNLCHTHGLSKQALMDMNEDPTDPGGYFIVGGVEWVVELIENIRYNALHMHRNRGHRNESSRGELISKPGDAFESSSEIIITLYTNRQLCCRIIRQHMRKDGVEIDLPFYVMFRLLGISTDREMFELICSGDTTGQMQAYLREAMSCAYPQLPDGLDIYDQQSTIFNLSKHLDVYKKQYNDFGELLGAEDDALNTRRYISNTLLDAIDKYFLPHMGVKDGNRYNKARFLGHLIHKLLLVEMGLIPDTDRDDYCNKRVHPTGISVSKAFKTQYNIAVVQKVKRGLTRDIYGTQFENINWARVVTQNINEADFEKLLSQAITYSGLSMRVGNQTFKNHLKAQQLHRKNSLNVISALRQISSPNTSSKSKSSERAKIMRRVHSSYPGYVCPVQSLESEQVGLLKQMAISVKITNTSHSVLLKKKVTEDDLFEPLNQVTTTEMVESRLTKIFINGEWMGFTSKPHDFTKKYIKMRRTGEIDKYTTVSYDFIINEIYLWTDAGRVVQPLLIVGNNLERIKSGESKKKIFSQGLLITGVQLACLYAQTMNIDDLLTAGVIEYIAPEECETLLIAQSYETLLEHKNDATTIYTHCEISQAILGLAALMSPYSHCNPMTRVCYHTNQIKQAGSWFAFNWKYRSEKETFLQYYNEVPLVRTIVNDFVTPCGLNAIVAIMCYGGYNQEDSIVISKTAAKRGLYTGTHFGFAKSELDRGESFASPSLSDTMDIKANANYEKLKDGIVRKGELIKNGDVIIGKRLETKDDKNFQYMDKSTVYRGMEDVIVENVIHGRNQNDVDMCKVVYRSIRQVSVGDKFSSRAGQKGVVGMSYGQEDLPFSCGGVVPEIIMNPHGLPGRMTVGQVIEAIVSKVCALHGAVTDGTTFTKVDIGGMCGLLRKLGYSKDIVSLYKKNKNIKSTDENINDILTKMGYNPQGMEYLFNPETGRKIQHMIFVAPTYYQRLQKFVEGSVYAVSSGPTDALTRQPVSGKASGGGLRVGEMERDVCVANGAVAFLQEKFIDHSDGFTIFICARCQSRDSVVVNAASCIYRCNRCKDLANIVQVPSSYATKLYFQEMRGMNIRLGFHIKDPQFEKHVY